MNKSSTRLYMIRTQVLVHCTFDRTKLLPT